MEQENLEALIRIDANVHVHHHFDHATRPPASQILIYGGTMGLSIVAGGAALLVQLIPLPSGSVFDSPANLALTCDNAGVVVAPESGDTTGTMFNVSAPASVAPGTANLNATGLAGGQQITGTAPLTITAEAPPPATSIGIVAASGAAAPPPAAAAKVALDASGAPVKGRAPAK